MKIMFCFFDFYVFYSVLSEISIVFYAQCIYNVSINHRVVDMPTHDQGGTKMKTRWHRGLALLLTLFLLSGNLAWAAEPPAQGERTVVEEREAERTEPPSPNEENSPSSKNAPAEEHLEVSEESVPTAQGEGTPENGVYAFRFTVSRPEDSEFESISSRYFNYWLAQSGNEVFDHTKWRLRNFQMAFDLHIADTAQTIRQNMSYEADEYKWHTEISFDNIHIPYPEVELVYYSPEDTEYFNACLIHYDLYLEKGNGK